MLTAMKLALVHSHAAPTFNADFYTTAAAVIPLLFIAVVLQGSTYADLLYAGRGRLERYNQAISENPLEAIAVGAIVGFLFATGLIAAVLILFFGVAGEIFALVTLYLGRRPPGAAGIVLTGAIVLTLAVGGARLRRLCGPYALRPRSPAAPLPMAQGQLRSQMPGPAWPTMTSASRLYCANRTAAKGRPLSDTGRGSRRLAAQIILGAFRSAQNAASPAGAARCWQAWSPSH
jgi:hypothetical protein